MKKQDYSTSITVNASAKDAFNSIKSISKWWTENVEGSSQKTGDEFTVRFGTTWKTFKITEVVPNKKIEWLVTDCHMPWNKDKTEWTGTKISFEISEMANKSDDYRTQIRFTHLGLVPEFNCFDACSNAWGQYIQKSLSDLVTKGKGQPETKEGKAKVKKE